MKTRKELLLDLIYFRSPILELRQKLQNYEWDSNEIVTLTKEIAYEVLTRFRKSVISSNELSEWADTIEARDDIKCDSVLIEMLFEFANPEINSEITQESVANWLYKLKE